MEWSLPDVHLLQKLAIIAVSKGVFPPSRIDRYRSEDPSRHEREQRKARSFLLVATPAPVTP
jgi:hypothetical protein